MWRVSVGVVMIIIALRGAQSQTEHIQCTLHSSNLPVPLHSAAVGFSNASQSAFLMGGLSAGFTDSGDAYSDAVYEWDIDSPSSAWFTNIATPAPTPFTTRGVHISASIGDVTYVVSPRTDLSTPPDSAIYPFDTATKQWLTPIPFTTPSGNELTVPCVTHNETHLILVDGFMASRSNSPIYILLYAISSDEWTTQSVEAPFGDGRVDAGWYNAMCAYANGHLYIFGGRSGPTGTSNYNYMDGVYKYDIETQTWTTLPALPTTQVYGTALYDGERYIYLVGGRVDGYEYLNDIRIFDVTTDQLSDHTMTAATAVSNAASMILGKDIWIFGGKISDADVTDIVQKCDISALLPTPTTASPTTTAPSTPSPTTAAPTTSRNPTTRNPTVEPSSDVHAPTRQPSFVPTELPSFNPSHLPTSKQPSHQPSSYPNLSSTPLRSQRNDTNYTISIEADGLTSTQVLLVVPAALFNVSSTPLVLVSADDDNDDGTSYVVLVATLPSDFELETDVIESTVREAIAKEYGDEVEVHINVEETKQPDAINSPGTSSQLWTILCSSGGACLCCSFVFAVVLYRRRQQKQGRVPPVGDAQPQQQVPGPDVDNHDQIEIPGLALLSVASQSGHSGVVALADVEEKKNDEGDKHKDKEKFVYDPNKNYKPEGARASIITPGINQDVVAVAEASTNAAATNDVADEKQHAGTALM